MNEPVMLCSCGASLSMVIVRQMVKCCDPDQTTLTLHFLTSFSSFVTFLPSPCDSSGLASCARCCHLQWHQLSRLNDWTLTPQNDPAESATDFSSSDCCSFQQQCSPSTTYRVFLSSWWFHWSQLSSSHFDNCSANFRQLQAKAADPYCTTTASSHGLPDFLSSAASVGID